MKGLSWQAVALCAVGISGFIVLYLLVPAEDPMRGALVVAFNGVIGALLAVGIGRRQSDVERKVDKVIEQTNGHTPDTGPPAP